MSGDYTKNTQGLRCYAANNVETATYDIQHLSNYLRDRKQYIKYNVHESNVMAIKSGMPQGSIFGPLLFSIYIYI